MGNESAPSVFILVESDVRCNLMSSLFTHLILPVHSYRAISWSMDPKSSNISYLSYEIWSLPALNFIDEGMTAVQILWQYLSKIGVQGIFHYSGFPEHRSSRHFRSRLFLELMHHHGHAVWISVWVSLLNFDSGTIHIDAF